MSQFRTLVVALIFLSFYPRGEIFATAKAEAADKNTVEEFPFDHAIAAKKAIDFMESEWKRNAVGVSATPDQNPRKLYDLRKPQFIAKKKVKNCKGKFQPMVAVAFKSKKGTGTGWAQLFLDKKKGFQGSETGADVTPIEDTLKSIGRGVECADH